MIDSLICVSGRIIGPFHQTVKIWSSHLDIQPGDNQIFVKLRIIGYNPRDFTIKGTKVALRRERGGFEIFPDPGIPAENRILRFTEPRRPA